MSSPDRLLSHADFVDSVGAVKGIVFLVGGYDGIGNYGDQVQLEQAANLVAKLGPQVAAVPVIDADNRLNAQGLAFNPMATCRPERTLFVTPAPQGANPVSPTDELVPAELPADVCWVATYLYGGGYLNG